MTNSRILGFFIACLLAAPALAQEAKTEKKAASKKGEPDQAAMMAAWQKYATPGENHAHLKALVGSWTANIKAWMAPGAPPTESTGTSECKLIMDGRYLQEEVRSSFMGMPFQGLGMTGYDNLKKKFVAAWVDNMGTGIMRSEGTYDAKTKTLTMTTDEPDPMTGKMVKGRDVLHMESETKVVREFYRKGPGGKEAKTMEIVYTKKSVATRTP